MTRGKPSGRPRRQVGRTAFRPELLVFVEGERTEERYLVDWAQKHRDRVLVRIDEFRGGPLQLVEHAVARKKEELREAKRSRGRPHDVVWCVFDVDQHPNIPQAVDLARRHGIELAITNPCIELWFILHFADQTAFLDSADAQRRAEDLLGCSKVLTDTALGLLADRYVDAAGRAWHLDLKHAGDGSAPGSNPSSGLPRLLEAIRTA